MTFKEWTWDTCSNLCKKLPNMVGDVAFQPSSKRIQNGYILGWRSLEQNIALSTVTAQSGKS